MSRVLLVDDLESNLLGLRAALGSLDAELVCVDSGEKAVAAAEEAEFAVAIIDVMMPAMDGLTTARRIKELRPALPFIFMTAHETANQLELDGYALGAVDYLVKPVDVRILRQKVAVFLQLHARTAALLAEQARKTEEQALRWQFERQWTLLAELFSAVPVGLCIVSGPDHVVEAMNARFAELSGAPRSRPASLFDLIPAAEPWLSPLLQAAVAAPAAATASEIEIGHTPSGPLFLDAVVARVSVGDQGRLCVCLIDVSQRVLACRAAEAASRVKDAFLTMVSHELRTPLNAIAGWASMLKGQQSSSPELVAKAVEVIERNARSQARIIEDILDVSRMVRNKLTIERSAVDLGAIVQQAVDAAAPEAAKKGLSLLSSCPAEPAVVSGDEMRLGQLAGNLISNAIKFTPRGGQISVHLAANGDTLSLVVSDSGIGINPSLLSDIFEPFHQAEVADSRRSKGVGLGLAIVRHIAQLHGGEVRAFSEGDGRGTTMLVELPAANPATAGLAPARTSALHRGVSLAGRRILVVEDAEDARMFFVMALRNAGAEVRAADGAEAALALLAQFVPDVVVSDLAMPGHDGFWLIARIRSLLPAVPSIAVSASIPPGLLLGGDQGFDEYLLKPIDETSLVRAVANRIALSTPGVP